MKWVRQNLFSDLVNSALTLACLALIAAILVPFLDWALFSAVFHGGSAEPCRAPGAGACWPFVTHNIERFVYGPFPDEEHWRINLILIIGAVALIAAAIPQAPAKRFNVLFLLIAYPLIAAVFLIGGRGGLALVPTVEWGGLMLTLIVAITGIVLSLPLGIVLALGRRSELPVVRVLCTVFIEVWRGVPLITVLFMATVMLPLFVPEGVTLDKLLRVLIGVALFSAAYMAEVVRGGLQAIPKGQFEAADALGLGYWKSMGLIIMPQALRHVIPGIVNTFIGLFKDTTLVLIVGLFDLLGMVQFMLTNPNWASSQTAATGYLFVGFVFWVFCFAMSRYSQAVERRLDTGAR